MMALKIIETADHSSSIYNDLLDETYHSRHGAIQESKHVFIRAGLKPLLEQKALHILELGFGTGLNAWLTAIEAWKSKTEIYYSGVEAFPLQPDIINKLNYNRSTTDPTEKKWFQSLHQAEWNKAVSIHSFFTLTKWATPMEVYSEKQRFDLVYFDAFAPRIQPELWTFQRFKTIYHQMKRKSVLVTYSCKGDVRRAMLKAGFQVEKIPGPPGKREMLRATKNER